MQIHQLENKHVAITNEYKCVILYKYNIQVVDLLLRYENNVNKTVFVLLGTGNNVSSVLYFVI